MVLMAEGIFLLFYRLQYFNVNLAVRKPQHEFLSLLTLPCRNQKNWNWGHRAILIVLLQIKGGIVHKVESLLRYFGSSSSLDLFCPEEVLVAGVGARGVAGSGLVFQIFFRKKHCSELIVLQQQLYLSICQGKRATGF